MAVVERSGAEGRVPPPGVQRPPELMLPVRSRDPDAVAVGAERGWSVHAGLE